MKRIARKKQRIVAVAIVLTLVVGTMLPLVISMQHAHALVWWNSSWHYRRKITFNNSASGTNLVNFPVRISLSSSNFSYGVTQSAGQDLRFIDADGSTVLSHEIESWNTSGTSEVWVKVPQLDAGSSTDFIWMYYGNPSASDGQNVTSVWDSNFMAVWHLKENPANTCSGTKEVCDSTANGVNGDALGSMTAANQVSGQIDGSLTFNGTANEVDFGDIAATHGISQVTLSGWMKKNVTTSHTSIGKQNTSCTDSLEMEFDNASSKAFFLPNDGGTGSVAFNDTSWHYWVMVFDGTQTGNSNRLKAYKDGVAQTLTYTGTISATTPSGTTTFNIAHIGSTGCKAQGNQITDEVRLSNTPRSADWIEAEYLNGINTFASYAAQEIYPPDPPTLTSLSAVVGGVPLQPQFQMRASDQNLPSYLRYKIDVCTNSDCSSILRTIDETASQTGWTGQDAQAGTAYVASSTLGSSTLASHTYQTPALTAGTRYWWRAYAIDPGDSNTWSDPSAIDTFLTKAPPAVPTLVSPANGATGVTPQGPFTLWTTDANSDYIQYKIDICTTSNCSSILRTIDQTSSQTGWASQNANSNTAYSSDPATITSSQLAVHYFQSPYLQPNTQYWWRAYAIDPAGNGSFTAASSINTFTTGQNELRIVGGTKIVGGVHIGN